MLADYINYITPVPAAQKVFEKEAAEAESKDDKEYYSTLATSPLIFPKTADYSKLHRYRVLEQDELDVWNGIFQPIYQS